MGGPDLSGEARFTVAELLTLRVERALSAIDPAWVLIAGMGILAVFAVITTASVAITAMGSVGDVETYTISTRDFPNIIAEREAVDTAALLPPAGETGRAAA